MECPPPKEETTNYEYLFRKKSPHSAKRNKLDSILLNEFGEPRSLIPSTLDLKRSGLRKLNFPHSSRGAD